MAHFIQLVTCYKKNRRSTVVNADYVIRLGEDSYGSYAELTNGDKVRGYVCPMDHDDAEGLNQTTIVAAEPGYTSVKVNCYDVHSDVRDEDGDLVVIGRAIGLYFDPVVAWKANPHLINDVVPMTASGGYEESSSPAYDVIIRPDGVVTDRDGAHYASIDEWLAYRYEEKLKTHKVQYFGLPADGIEGVGRHQLVEKPAAGYRPPKAAKKSSSANADKSESNSTPLLI